MKKKKVVILKNSSNKVSELLASHDSVSAADTSISSSSFNKTKKKKREKFSKKGDNSGLLSTTSAVYEGNHVNSAEEQHHYPSDSPLSNSILPHGSHDDFSHEVKREGGMKKKFSILKKDMVSPATREIPTSLILSLVVNPAEPSSAAGNENPPTSMIGEDSALGSSSAKLSRREKAKLNREKFSSTQCNEFFAVSSLFTFS
jgi:hypothetical protein